MIVQGLSQTRVVKGEKSVVQAEKLHEMSTYCNCMQQMTECVGYIKRSQSLERDYTKGKVS
jgi:hypothetical protein